MQSAKNFSSRLTRNRKNDIDFSRAPTGTGSQLGSSKEGSKYIAISGRKHLNSGLPTDNWYAYFVNIILGVTLVAVFIGIFYFTFVKNIEAEIAEKNVDIIVDDFTTQYSNFVSPDVIAANKANIDKNFTVSPDLQKSLAQADIDVAAANAKLLKKTALVIAMLLVLGTASIILLYTIAKKKNQPVKLRTILFENMIILTFVALTEFCFLVLVTKNYISADVNRLKRKAISTTTLYGTS